MCLLRTLHFSIHDVRPLMTIEPFSRKDDNVFINPSETGPHHCEVRLPRRNRNFFFGSEVLGSCDEHSSCCVTSSLFQRCARFPLDSEFGEFRGCRFFTTTNEYIPYESVMSPPEPGTAEVTRQATPLWTADIKPYPHRFYPGRPFDRRRGVDAEAIHVSRAHFFSIAGNIYKKKQDLATWIETQHQCLRNEVFQTPQGIKSLEGAALHWKLEELSSTVRSAQDILSLAAEASEIANELSKKPNSVIKSSALWSPDEEGPLLFDLEDVVKQWEALVKSWRQLNFG